MADTLENAHLDPLDPSVPQKPSSTAPLPSSSERYRPDIEGLRAIAILLIVAYHAGLPGFSGGFIGVDVFFVISGFLITRNLLDESTVRGTIRFREFWARRIRRLVPALAIMIVATLAFSYFIFAPFDTLNIAKQGGASALYVSNILFATNAQNYFAPSINKSPFLHTWSLGVEEQFYLVWPFVVFVALVVGRRFGRSVRSLALPFFSILLVASFALNWRWTDAGSPWAFFSLPTRAWEFAIGGLLACVALPEVLTRVRSICTGAVGLALLAYATVSFDSFTPYPGLNAVLPVVGTALLIVSGQRSRLPRPTVLGRFLGSSPMTWTGRISYSWYLWHWPFIVLTVLALNDDAVSVRVLASIVSLGVAYVVFSLVENPVRFRASLVRSARRTYLVGAVITLVVLAVAGGTWILASQRTPTSFTNAKNLAFRHFFAVCTTLTAPDGTHYCAGGDTASKTVVALVGDSHAGTWFNAMSEVGSKLNVRVVQIAEPGCPFIPVTVRPLANGPVDTAQCLAFRKAGLHLLSELKPRAVVLSEHDGQYLGLITDKNGNVPPVPEQVVLWKAAVIEFVEEMRVQGIRPAVIMDNPTLPYDPAECVSQTGSIAACEPSLSTALSPGRPLIDGERAVFAHAKVPVFDPDGILCNRTGCPLELHNQLIYGDTNHLLFGATRMMEPEITALLRSVLVPNT